MQRLVSDIGHLTAERLGALLERAIGQLDVARSGETLSGAFAHVRADGVPLFVKWTRPDCFSERQADANAREVWFYRSFAADADLQTPACHFAESTPEGANTLVLDDLSATHRTWSADVPDWEEHCVDALARLHATFWNHPKLSDVRVGSPVPSITNWRQRLHGRVAGMLEALENTAPEAAAEAESKATAEILHGLIDLECWEARLERVGAAVDVTLQHGDPHPRNFLYGKTSATPVDWQLIDVGVATGDVAHLLVFHCANRMEALRERYRAASSYDAGRFEQDWAEAVRLCPLIVSAFWQNGLRDAPLARALEASLSALRTIR